ncbi:MAG: outer membrane beta-barrel protein [Candidatus Didemnitutus sp.]|nr:outer membrane beta-barrel protein [Candidatus Didemnitutus sp.]
MFSLLALSASSLTAAPFVALGDNAELFLTGSVVANFDDNIYLRNGSAGRPEVNDTILTFTPGVDVVFGKNAATTGNFYFREDIVRYSDNDQQNTELLNVGFNSLYSNGKSKLDLGASYAESAQNDTGAPGDIVSRKTTAVRALSEFGVTEKTSFGAGVRWEKINYDAGPGYLDNRAWSVPLDAYFEYSPKLQWSAGYRYRSTELSGAGIDRKDHFFNIGARGEFTPKLTGQLRVGYSLRKLDRGDDDSGFGVDSSFNYAYSPKTTYTLGVTNDFGTSALGESTKNFSINLGANNRIDEQWSWNANLVYRSTDYPAHSDDFWQGGVGVSYVYNNNVNFTASYTHRNNSSNASLFEFSNNVFSIGANLRY